MEFKPGVTLAYVERVVILRTLEACNDNKTRAAAVLGISLKTLYNRLHEYSDTPAVKAHLTLQA